MSTEKKDAKAQPQNQQYAGKNAAPPQPQPKAAPSQPQPKAPSILSLNQKIALVAAAAIIALVLAVPLFTQGNPMPPIPSTPVTSQEFMGRLAYAPSVGIFMDARGVTNATQRQKLFQCGADLASSLAGSPVLAEKERIVAACDDSSCLLSNQSSNKTINTSASQILLEMSRITYIHIKGGVQGAPSFYSNRMEFPITSAATGSCRIGATEENNSDLTIIPNDNNQNTAIENNSQTLPDSQSQQNGTDASTPPVPPAMPALNGTPENASPQTEGGPQK